MNNQRQKGFTLVEVLLFLAITGFFILIVFVGLRGRTDNLRRSDAMRELESFMTSEVNAIENGVNVSSDASNQGSDPNEVLLGRMYEPIIGSDKINAYVIYGDRLSNIADRRTDPVDRLISDSNPRVDTAVSPSNYQVKWGLLLDSTWSSGGGGGFANQVAYFGFLKNPATNLMHVVVMEGDNQTLNAVSHLSDDTKYLHNNTPGSRTGYSPHPLDPPVSIHLCYEDPDNRRSEIAIAASSLTATIEAFFDDKVINSCRISP